jgi:APA family basic amino acid/polyamine antiporter
MGYFGRGTAATAAPGAVIVFFALLGFEETQRPQRDMPNGIVGSIAVVTLLFMLVSLVLTGMVPYAQLNTAAPMATALVSVGQQWAAGLVSPARSPG